MLVVDDGSTDNSLLVLEKFANKIKIIKSINYGVSTARNLGIVHSSGKYLAFLDSDDMWQPTKIEKQVQALNNSSSHLVYCQMDIVNGNNESIGFTDESRSGDFRKDFLKKPCRTPFIPSTILFKRELLIHSGIFDTTFNGPSEDFDFIRRCSKFTNFEIVQERLTLHREHSQSVTSGSLDKYYADNKLAVQKMLADEYTKVGPMEMRMCWIRFNLEYFKAFAKQKRFMKSFLILISCVTLSLNMHR